MLGVLKEWSLCLKRLKSFGQAGDHCVGLLVVEIVPAMRPWNDNPRYVRQPFKQIDAFRSVMVAGSVVGAAKLMNVTQPVVSRTVGLLEMRLGYDLFLRRGRRLLPTSEAEALYREVEHLYGGLDRIAQVAQDIRYQRAGALRIATLPALAQGLVPRAIARFVSARPNVTVVVQSLPSRQIAELVSTRQVDVGIVELPQTRPGTVLEALPQGRMVALLSSTHPLAKRKSISLKDLDGERMITAIHGAFNRYQIDQAFSEIGAAPQLAMETGSSTIACALVAAGAAAFTLVERLTAEPFAGRDLVVCQLKEDLPTHFALIFPQLAVRMALADAFASVVREELEQGAARFVGQSPVKSSKKTTARRVQG